MSRHGAVQLDENAALLVDRGAGPVGDLPSKRAGCDTGCPQDSLRLNSLTACLTMQVHAVLIDAGDTKVAQRANAKRDEVTFSSGRQFGSIGGSAG